MAGRIAYYGNIATQGLVVNLDAAIQGSYPKTGSTWFDISNNAKNATLINNITFTPTNFGSLDINNEGDYFIFSDNNIINIQSGDSVTFNVWINIPSYVDYGNPGFWRTGTNFMIFTNVSGRPWVRWGGNNILQPGSGYSVPLNTWVYITYVVESGGPGVYFYVNGELKHSNTHNTVAPSFSITQLGYQQNILQYILGKYGSVTFYNRALSSTEITQNFNALRGRYGI